MFELSSGEWAEVFLVLGCFGLLIVLPGIRVYEAYQHAAEVRAKSRAKAAQRAEHKKLKRATHKKNTLRRFVKVAERVKYQLRLAHTLRNMYNDDEIIIDAFWSMRGRPQRIAVVSLEYTTEDKLELHILSDDRDNPDLRFTTDDASLRRAEEFLRGLITKAHAEHV